MLRVRQQSALNGFHYEIHGPGDDLLGELDWPNFAQAKNARLRWHPEGSPLGDVQMHLAGGPSQGHYRIGFEFLTRAWRNDVRFTLHQGHAPLAVAEVRFLSERIRRPTIQMLLPVEASLIRQNRWGRARCAWMQGGQSRGTLEEPHWFSFKRELSVDLPSTLSLPIQIFAAFLVINDAFR